ncbi:MAG: hypothetical protein JWP97_2300 [Labilithrix sp.]|nr:hypothetical protein [Labilithrix sp.]
MSRLVPLCSVLLACLALGGCTHVKPWERGKLAHPTMTGMENGPAAEHVYAVQEGATGGGASAESGCGCN